MIARRLRDDAETEDVLQEVFEDFLEAYDLGEAIESLGAWLARVARNKIIDRFRKKGSESSHQEDLLATAEEELEQTTEEEFDRAILREELAEAIALLPPEQRDVFVMHELEGKTFETIASETGTNINTLLARKRYAVLFLRQHLKEIYDEFGE